MISQRIKLLSCIMLFEALTISSATLVMPVTTLKQFNNPDSPEVKFLAYDLYISP